MELRNIVFDLGGVVFARDPEKCSEEFLAFFSFILLPEMPLFWEEYDRGTLTLEEVKNELCAYHGCERSKCDDFITTAIAMQEEIAPTKALIEKLRAAGYDLYVLSNMSREFIDFLRKMPVYGNFKGDVVSCEVHTVKPEPEIYEILLSKFGLEPSETLFVDDRQANIEAASELGLATCLFDRRNPAVTCSRLERLLLG